MSEIDQVRAFFERRIKELSDEIVAYGGLLKIVRSSTTYRMASARRRAVCSWTLRRRIIGSLDGKA